MHTDIVQEFSAQELKALELSSVFRSMEDRHAGHILAS
jgi:hypothetical protein